MKPHVRQKKVGAHISARLSDTEAGRVAEAAALAGLTVSQWGRQSLINALDCPPWARLMLGEFLALRSVVVDLQHSLIQGGKPSAERIKAILDVADQRKLALADARLLNLTPAKRENEQ